MSQLPEAWPPQAGISLRSLLQRFRPRVVFLSETKLSGSDMKMLTNWVLSTHSCSYDGYHVDARGRSGGLALLFDRDV